MAQLHKGVYECVFVVRKTQMENGRRKNKVVHGYVGNKRLGRELAKLLKDPARQAGIRLVKEQIARIV